MSSHTFLTCLLLHADSQPTVASTVSLLQSAQFHTEHAAQPSHARRGKPGSSLTAATAIGKPSGKSSEQPAQPFVSLTSKLRPKPSAAPEIQADGTSRADNKSLPAHNDSSACSTFVQPAALPESTAIGHGNVALLPHIMSAQKLPQKQASKRSATALLPVPKVTLPAISQGNAEPDGKAAAAIPQVHASMEGVIKDTGRAAVAMPQVPQSKEEGVRKDTDSLLMVRRLPAVLTATLPTLESLGVQLKLPCGADMLSKAFFWCNQPAPCYHPAL